MLRIRLMKDEDIKLVYEWANNEGWNTPKNDYKAAYYADPNGFFMLEFDNQPVASISAVRYSEDFSFIGCYIVHPTYRKMGFGIQIWEHAINYLSNCKAIGLYAVAAQVSNYKKSNFFTLFKNNRWCGKSYLKASDNLKVAFSDKYDTKLLASYELRVFNVSRENFIKKLISLSDTYCIVATDKESNICGYGVVRLSNDNSYRIGPLYAEDENIAEKIFLELFTKIGADHSILLDCPDINLKFSSLASKLNLKLIDNYETYAMYRGNFPNIEGDKVYSITSLELG